MPACMCILGYARDSRNDVAADLYTCMQQFYNTFPDELKNDLYITGESYAGQSRSGSRSSLLSHTTDKYDK